MALTLYWTKFAKEQIKSIFDYYKERTNKKIAKSIIDKIVRDLPLLLNHPEVGAIESLLTNRP